MSHVIAIAWINMYDTIRLNLPEIKCCKCYCDFADSIDGINFSESFYSVPYNVFIQVLLKSIGISTDDGTLYEIYYDDKYYYQWKPTSPNRFQGAIGEYVVLSLGLVIDYLQRTPNSIQHLNTLTGAHLIPTPLRIYRCGHELPDLMFVYKRRCNGIEIKYKSTGTTDSDNIKLLLNSELFKSLLYYRRVRIFMVNIISNNNTIVKVKHQNIPITYIGCDNIKGKLIHESSMKSLSRILLNVFK